MGRVAVLAFAVSLGAAAPALADGPITNRNYAIDIYEGVAIGNTAWIAMGGAGAALMIGTAGALINPSAPVVRKTTDTSRWSWDYHFDILSAAASKDYDNNGVLLGAGGAQLFTAGLGMRIGDWASAITYSWQETPIFNATPEESDDLSARGQRFRYVLAKHFPDKDLSVGLGIQNVDFKVRSPDEETLFKINGTGIVGGITYTPWMRSYRLAGAVETQILGANVSFTCDPDNCMGYILPNSVVSPARVIGGFAYRFGPTPWNQYIKRRYRDEQALTVTTDVIVTGKSPNAYGIEAFGQQELQRSGRHTAVSVRAGAELEALPGRLRLRGGSYWEPQRFVDQGGRLHVTFGVELRVFEFWLFGKRRGRISLTGDVASQYRNVAASIGFWQ